MSLIKADDIWALWSIIIGIVAFSIYIEQKNKIAAKISGPVIGWFIAIALSNFKILPMESDVYNVVYAYFLPIAVTCLLFKADARKVFKETGQTLIAFHIGVLGTCIGAIVAYFAFRGNTAMLKLIPLMTGSYIGGGVNFFAMADVFKPDSSVIGAAIVADNFVLAFIFMWALYIPGTKFFRKHYRHPHETEVEESVKLADDSVTMQGAYWKAKEISLKDIAFALAFSIIIAGISVKVAGLISNNTSGLINTFFGNTFVIITTFALICATAFPNFFGNLKGTDEIGTFLIYMFFVVIAFPASITDLVTKAPAAFILVSIIACCNVITLLGLGKLFKFNIEEICISISATLGGPSNAIAMSIARGWQKLIVPGLLVGLWGYVIGNYCGIIIGKLIGL